MGFRVRVRVRGQGWGLGLSVRVRGAARHLGSERRVLGRVLEEVDHLGAEGAGVPGCRGAEVESEPGPGGLSLGMGACARTWAWA